MVAQLGAHKTGRAESSVTTSATSTRPKPPMGILVLVDPLFSMFTLETMRDLTCSVDLRRQEDSDMQ
jgi:hypothetical protein